MDTDGILLQKVAKDTGVTRPGGSPKSKVECRKPESETRNREILSGAVALAIAGNDTSSKIFNDAGLLRTVMISP